jgi:hypothetical protein
VLVWRRAGELDGDLVEGRIRRDRHLRVRGCGADALLELGICRGSLPSLAAFPVGDIDELEPSLRRESAVQPRIQKSGLGAHQRGTLAPLSDEHVNVFGGHLEDIDQCDGRVSFFTTTMTQRDEGM